MMTEEERQRQLAKLTADAAKYAAGAAFWGNLYGVCCLMLALPFIILFLWLLFSIGGC